MIRKDSPVLPKTSEGTSASKEKTVAESMEAMSLESGKTAMAAVGHTAPAEPVSLQSRVVTPVMHEMLDGVLASNKKILSQMKGGTYAKLLVELESFLIKGFLGRTQESDGPLVACARSAFDGFCAMYPMVPVLLMFLKALVCEQDNNQVIKSFGDELAVVDDHFNLLRVNIIKFTMLYTIMSSIKQVREMSEPITLPSGEHIYIIERYMCNCLKDLKTLVSARDKSDTLEFTRYGMLILYLLSMEVLTEIVEGDLQETIRKVILDAYDYLLNDETVRSIAFDDYVRSLGYVFSVFLIEYDTHNSKSSKYNERRFYGVLKKNSDGVVNESGHGVEMHFKKIMARYSFWTENYDEAFSFIMRHVNVNSATDIVTWYSRILVIMTSVDHDMIMDKSVIKIIMEIQKESVIVDPKEVDLAREAINAERVLRDREAQQYLDGVKEWVNNHDLSEVDKKKRLHDAKLTALEIKNSDKSLERQPRTGMGYSLSRGRQMNNVAERLSHYLVMKFYTSVFQISVYDDPQADRDSRTLQPVSPPGGAEALPIAAKKDDKRPIVSIAEKAVEMLGHETTLHLFGEGVYQLFQKRESEAVTHFTKLLEKIESEEKKGIRASYPCFDPSLKLCRLLIALCYERQGAKAKGKAKVREKIKREQYEKALKFLETEKVLDCADKVTALARIYLALKDKQAINRFLKKYPEPPSGNIILWEALVLTARASSSDELRSEAITVIRTAELDKDLAVESAVPLWPKIQDAMEQNKSILNKKDYAKFMRLAEEGIARLASAAQKKKKGKKSAPKVESSKKRQQQLDTKQEEVQSQEIRKTDTHRSELDIPAAEKQEISYIDQAEQWVASDTYKQQVRVVEKQICDVSADLDYASFWEDFYDVFEIITSMGKGYDQTFTLLKLLMLQERTYQRSRVIAGSNLNYICEAYNAKKEREAIRGKKLSLATNWLQNAKDELILIFKSLGIKIPDDFVKNITGLFTDQTLSKLKDPLLAAFLSKSKALRTRLAGVIAAIGHLIAEGERIDRYRGPSQADDFFRVANKINPDRVYRKMGCSSLTHPELEKTQGAEAMPGLLAGIV